MKYVAIIDLQTSNIKSVIGACKRVKLKYILTSNPSDLKKAQGIILPGVGSFKYAMSFLKKKKLINPIKKFYLSGKPIMGICLGMQLFFKNSPEYGKTKGLNIISREVKKFPVKKCKLPNIGWSRVDNLNIVKSEIFNTINHKKHFYFVHSYYIEKFSSKNFKIGYSRNDNINFCSFINYKNLYLFQFHPEKSSLEGIKIYNNFKNLLKNAKNAK